MKQGKPVINTVMIALAVALAVYFGVYIYNSLDTPYHSTLAYEYTLYDSAQAEGIMVRDETVLPAQNGIVDVIRGEGERVGVGQTVAMVYRDTQAQADQASLEQMSMEYDLLNYAMSTNGDVESAARLDEGIIQATVALRDAAARNDYTDLEEQVMQVKSSVLKRGYTYGDGVDATELEARKAELKAQMNTLTAQTTADTSRVNADKAGTYSHMVDGMEAVATPKAVAAMNPDQLRELMGQSPQPAEGAVGKLISSDRWSFAAIVDSKTAERMKLNDYVTVRFSGDFSQDVPMRVDHISQPEGSKEAAVVFSSDRYLARTTLLRQQSAEVIFKDYTGLRVPKEALKMIKGTQTDEETGKETEYTMLGVYVIVAGRTEFKEAEVVAEGSDYYVLKPAGDDRKMLRAGDEVITRGTGIYAGQNFKD